jgi:hypothetical protein
VLPNFRVGEPDAAALAAVCRRLDGIPFAIELAAARLRVLSLTSLAERLDDRFKLLGTGNRTVVPRHQTLRALLDWSYDLLTVEERTLLHRLAIFAGPFTLEAATAVYADDQNKMLLVLDLVSALVDKSLLSAEPRDDRYRMLESTRAYARERLSNSLDYHLVSLRYATYCAKVARRIGDLHWTLPTEDWLRAALPEAENVLDALRWCLDAGQDYQLAGEIAGQLNHFWRATAYRAQGERLIDRVLAALGPEPTPILALLYLARAHATDVPSLEVARRAVELFEQVGDEQGLALAYTEFAIAATVADGSRNVDHCFDAAIEIAGRLDRPLLLVYILERQTIPCFMRGDYVQAAALARRVQLLFERLGDPVQAGIQLARQAEALFAATRSIDQPLVLAEGGYALYRGQTVARAGRLWCLMNLAAYNVIAGKFDEAHRVLCEAWPLSRAVGSQTMLGYGFEFLAATLAGRGESRRGARIAGFAAAYIARERMRRYPTEQTCHEILMTHLRAALSPNELEGLLAEGAACGQDLMLSEMDRALAAGGGHAEHR